MIEQNNNIIYCFVKKVINKILEIILFITFLFLKKTTEPNKVMFFFLLEKHHVEEIQDPFIHPCFWYFQRPTPTPLGLL